VGLAPIGHSITVAITTSILHHPYFKRFVAFLRLKNITERTVEKYGKIPSALFGHIGPDVVAPEHTTTDHLRDYIAALPQKRLAPKTVAGCVVVIKRFFGVLPPVGGLG
jgi:site-specific recombinase XerD